MPWPCARGALSSQQGGAGRRDWWIGCDETQASFATASFAVRPGNWRPLRPFARTCAAHDPSVAGPPCWLGSCRPRRGGGPRTLLFSCIRARISGPKPASASGAACMEPARADASCCWSAPTSRKGCATRTAQASWRAGLRARLVALLHEARDDAARGVVLVQRVGELLPDLGSSMQRGSEFFENFVAALHRRARRTRMRSLWGSISSSDRDIMRW